MPLNIYDPDVARLLVDARQDGKAIGIEIGGRSAAARITALEAENARLREGLSKAAAQFEFYRNVHLEKCTEDGRLKAAANERMALMCRALLQGGPDAG